MNKKLLATGSACAAIAVILGAFGAHALKAKLAPEQLLTFETGVKYQMYHALALLILGILDGRFKSKLITYSGYLFIAGILFFSGSVYLLSTRELLGIESWKFLGPVTPLGGLCFISGWALLFIAVLKTKPHEN